MPVVLPQVLIDKLGKEVADGLLLYGQELEDDVIEKVKKEVAYDIEQKIFQHMKAELKPIEEFKRTASERLAVIETEIRNMKDMLNEQFKRIDERFEKIDEQFERIDERFEKIDEQFERIDERFEKIDEQFERIDERFEKIDERFEKINERFDKINDQFERINQQFIRANDQFYLRINSQTRWMITTMIAMTGIFAWIVRLFIK